jgi:hypothetical protein
MENLINAKDARLLAENIKNRKYDSELRKIFEHITYVAAKGDFAACFSSISNEAVEYLRTLGYEILEVDDANLHHFKVSF